MLLCRVNSSNIVEKLKNGGVLSYVVLRNSYYDFHRKSKYTCTYITNFCLSQGLCENRIAITYSFDKLGILYFIGSMGHGVSYILPLFTNENGFCVHYGVRNEFIMNFCCFTFFCLIWSKPICMLFVDLNLNAHTTHGDCVYLH